MSVQPLHSAKPSEDFRVLKGRRLRRPSLAPWIIMFLIAIVAFLGLGFATTSLDKSAFELAELTKSIEEQAAINRQLSLEIAQLENPARIAPLAEELGMVIPQSTNQILVDLDDVSPVVATAETDRTNQ